MTNLQALTRLSPELSRIFEQLPWGNGWIGTDTLFDRVHGHKPKNSERRWFIAALHDLEKRGVAQRDTDYAGRNIWRAAL